MNKKPAVPLFSDPDENPNNLANPYSWNVVDSSRGYAYFNAPASNSTMVSDVVEMTKRLKAYVPASSVREGRQPTNNNGYANSVENYDEGANYKAKYQ